MLPPIDDAVLQDNPDFANLYKTLATSILNQNGTSKYDPAHKEREAIREELNQYRLLRAKYSILASSISNLVPTVTSQSRKSLPKPGMSGQQQQATKPTSAPSTSSPGSPLSSLSPNSPPELLELILLLPSLLLPGSMSLPPSDLSLLFTVPPLSNLSKYIPALSSHLSTSLREQATVLSRIASPSTNPSYIHRVIPTLPSLASSQSTTVTILKVKLRATRLEALHKTLLLLEKHAHALVLLSKSLEAKHTIVARHFELSAAIMALEARRGEAAARTAFSRASRTVYTPSAVHALKSYARHLRDARARVEETIRTLEMELAAYGVGVDGLEQKERTMKEVARVYRDMDRQIDEVTADLERLKKG